MSPVKTLWRRVAAHLDDKSIGNDGEDQASQLSTAAILGTLLLVVLALANLQRIAPGAALGVGAVAAPAAIGFSILIFRARRWRGPEWMAPFGHAEHHYKALSDAVGDLVMHHEANGHVLSVGDDARRIFEVDAEEFVGAGFFNRIHVADRPAFLQAIHDALRGNETASTTLRLRSGAFSRSLAGFDEPVFAWAEIRIRRLHRQGDALRAEQKQIVVSVTRNITDAREVERRLEAARAEAELAISLKDRLLANVSHELRTPLNAILGFSEILGNVDLSPTDPAKRIEYARIIHSSAEHLLSVVNLVLDMSKIEAGKFEIAPEPFELEPLVKDCCDMLRLKAESGRVALISAPLDSRQEIVADKRACRQILLNLMSNAVKFTRSEGQVTIGADVFDKAIHIHVTDTGIGIAPDHLPRLGDPFFQVRSNYDRSFEGAGLGLSLVRGLVGLHGGSLLLESAPGVGTRVTVKLPLDCRSAPGAGVGAPRLETAALSPGTLHRISPNRDATANPRAEEERRIA